MNIWVNGTEKSDTLGVEIARQAEALRSEEYDVLLADKDDILALRDANSVSEYLAQYIAVIRRRSDVNPTFFTQTRKPGVKGCVWYVIRMFLWKLLRYQHFWSTFHQNAINATHAEALDFERQERIRETSELETRIRDLERTVRELRAGDSQ